MKLEKYKWARRTLDCINAGSFSVTWRIRLCHLIVGSTSAYSFAYKHKKCITIPENPLLPMLLQQYHSLRGCKVLRGRLYLRYWQLLRLSMDPMNPSCQDWTQRYKECEVNIERKTHNISTQIFKSSLSRIVKPSY